MTTDTTPKDFRNLWLPLYKAYYADIEGMALDVIDELRRHEPDALSDPYQKRLREYVKETAGTSEWTFVTFRAKLVCAIADNASDVWDDFLSTSDDEEGMRHNASYLIKGGVVQFETLAYYIVERDLMEAVQRRLAEEKVNV